VTTSTKAWGEYEPSESDVTAVYDRQTGRLRIAHGDGDDQWIEGNCLNLLAVR